MMMLIQPFFILTFIALAAVCFQIAAGFSVGRRSSTRSDSSWYCWRAPPLQQHTKVEFPWATKHQGKGGLHLTSPGMNGEDSVSVFRPKVTAEEPSGILVGDKFEVKEATRKDLEAVTDLCVDVFFPNVASGANPLKGVQRAQLYKEQLSDLSSRCRKMELSNMFKAVSKQTGKIVGFVEISVQAGYKYGMGDGVVLNDFRPVLTNLAVDLDCRRQGIGQALEQQCQDAVREWGYDEIVLQVEEDNAGARAFYRTLGYADLFVDRAARRYNAGGLWLRNVRTAKVTMQKAIPRALGGRNGEGGRCSVGKKSVFGDLTAVWGGLFGTSGNRVPGN